MSRRCSAQHSTLTARLSDAVGVTSVEGRSQSRPPLVVRAPWLAPTAIAVLALAASLISVTNGFAFDDLPVIVRDARIHSLGQPWRFFTQPYWGPPSPPGLYRPLTSLSLAAQWAAGGGSAWLFHLVSILLHVAVALAILRLGQQLLGRTGGWWAAALFAVHPVHAEVIATGVGQAELWAALLTVIAVGCYVRFRREGMLGGRRTILIAVLYLTACGFKENAIVLPGLLLALEATVLVGVRAAAANRDVRRLMVLLLIVAAGFWIVHVMMSGSAAGDHAALAFHGMNAGERLMTMLGIVPEWFRLLLWPLHLKVEYLPGEIHLARTFGLPQLLGAALLAGTTALAVMLRHRLTVFTLGVLWTAVAIFPVSNVIIPSGVVLAERTLYLPSVGVVLALGAVIAWAAERAGGWSSSARRAAVVAGGAVLLAGVVRTALRLPVWHDMRSFREQSLLETPNSYKTHWARGVQLFQSQDFAGGERELVTAMTIFPNDPQLLARLADHYRATRRCDAAVELYGRSLAIDDSRFYLRQRMVACLIKLGRLDEAMAVARRAIAGHERDARSDSVQVDSAMRRSTVNGRQ